MKDVGTKILPDLEIQELLPGLDIQMSKSSDGNYFYIYPLIANAVYVMEYIAKEEINSSGWLIRTVISYIEEYDENELNKFKNIIEKDIKKIESISGMLKEIMDLHKTCLKFMEYSMIMQ